MGTRLTWTDNNLAEDGHRVYKSTSPMDPLNMPAPLVELGPDVTLYDDPDVITGNTYYYRVGAFVGTVEKISEEIQFVAEEITVPTTNLLFHFTMDTIVSGELVSEDGVYNAPITGATQVTGKIGQALSFDGVNDVVTIGDFAEFNVTKFSISSWIKTDTPNAGDMGVVMRDGSGGTQKRIFQTGVTSGEFKFIVFNSSNNVIFNLVTTGGLVTTGWHHFAVTLSSTEAKIYVDGTEVATTTYTGTPNTNGGEAIALGRRASNVASVYKGLIDQVRFYTRALTASEINDLYMEGA